jgi:hypothetical protein
MTRGGRGKRTLQLITESGCAWLCHALLLARVQLSFGVRHQQRFADMDELQQLAALLTEMNRIGNKVSELIQRPAITGHIGEFIASRIFDIALETSATTRGMDGRFRAGPLSGRSVNIKYYPRLETLDIRGDALPEYFLVLAGPRGSAATSRGRSRPFVVDHAFVFDATSLCADLTQRGVKIQTGSSLLRSQWDAAELYPAPRSPLFHVTDSQRAMLSLFASPAAE